jgi:hypothetical protein
MDSMEHQIGLVAAAADSRPAEDQHLGILAVVVGVDSLDREGYHTAQKVNNSVAVVLLVHCSQTYFPFWTLQFPKNLWTKKQQKVQVWEQ